MDILQNISGKYEYNGIYIYGISGISGNLLIMKLIISLSDCLSKARWQLDALVASANFTQTSRKDGTQDVRAKRARIRKKNTKMLRSFNTTIYHYIYYIYIYINHILLISGFVWKCSVPLNPMVLLIIIPMKNGYFIGKINPTFSDKPMLR